MTWPSFIALTIVGVVLFGCSSIYLKHPTSGAVVECDPVWYAPLPWQAVARETCRSRWKDRGFVVVEKCKDAASGAPCVTDEERKRAK
jgi:hypothetical protein